MVSVLLLVLGNKKPGSSDELGGGNNARHRAGVQGASRPPPVPPDGAWTVGSQIKDPD